MTPGRVHGQEGKSSRQDQVVWERFDRQPMKSVRTHTHTYTLIQTHIEARRERDEERRVPKVRGERLYSEVHG